MKPKAATLQERMGFKDAELATPAHDAIMLWLDQNVEGILKLQPHRPWDPSYVEKIRTAARASAKEDRQKALRELRSAYWAEGKTQTPGLPEVDPELILTDDPPERLSIVKKIWESPVLSGNYTVGFIDMQIDISGSWLSFEGYPARWILEEGARTERYFIEVKPKIESLGEVIRQVRFYQTHCCGDFYVCCPDNRFEQQLASQDIGFIQSPRGI